jgi:hypothetical protein
MKVLNDDGPLRIEDHESSMRVVHKASDKVVLSEDYSPGSIGSWTAAFAYARGFQKGWDARKRAQYVGKSE